MNYVCKTYIHTVAKNKTEKPEGVVKRKGIYPFNVPLYLAFQMYGKILKYIRINNFNYEMPLLHRMALHKEKAYKCIMFLFIVLILYSWIPRKMKGIIGLDWTSVFITIGSKNNDTNTYSTSWKDLIMCRKLLQRENMHIALPKHWLWQINLYFKLTNKIEK